MSLVVFGVAQRYPVFIKLSDLKHLWNLHGEAALKQYFDLLNSRIQVSDCVQKQMAPTAALKEGDAE